MDPADITAVLGHRPTESWKKGDALASGPRSRAQSVWFLKAPDSKKGDLDHQLQWLFSRLTDDMRRWTRIGRQHRMRISVGIFMEAANRGFEISPSSMRELSRRGLLIGFDVYYNPSPVTLAGLSEGGNRVGI